MAYASLIALLKIAIFVILQIIALCAINITKLLRMVRNASLLALLIIAISVLLRIEVIAWSATVVTKLLRMVRDASLFATIPTVTFVLLKIIAPYAMKDIMLRMVNAS
jgi:hypothetical protein